MQRRRPWGTAFALTLAGLLLIARYAGGVSWAARAAVAVLIGTLVVRIGIASIGPLQVGAKSHPPVDVVESGSIPVYACAECGTQLVLLRKGNDKPPRHCGEPMRLSMVEDQDQGQMRS